MGGFVFPFVLTAQRAAPIEAIIDRFGLRDVPIVTTQSRLHDKISASFPAVTLTTSESLISGPDFYESFANTTAFRAYFASYLRRGNITPRRETLLLYLSDAAFRFNFARSREWQIPLFFGTLPALSARA